ncbi:MAG: NAD(P)H-dependent oxidoreductase subunit E [Deltaproteobacteria bacterium]|nr:NAD(P)H-dependent oxidoreductase subunit E [Deltaproteobacteria bacterium]
MNQSLEAQVDPQTVIDWVSDIGKDPSSTVPLLQAIQSKYGYLPRPAMDLVVENTEITGSQLYGVATFYSQFRLKPVGRHLIKVCHGTACHVQGADRLNTSLKHILKLEGEEQDTAENGSYTIEDVACVGCCSLAPVMVVGDEIFGHLDGSTAQRKLKKHARVNEEILPSK